MDIPTRFKQLMNRATMRLPSQHDPAQYTAEVMERVRALQQPAAAAPPIILWRSWPRLGLATALVVAALALVVLPQRHTVRVAQQIDQEAALLLAVDEPVLNGGEDELVEELETLDTMVLAQVGPDSDEAWLEETLQLLDEVGDDAALEDVGSSSEEDEKWLEELELMDDTDLSSSS